jgi:hypothetical protein
MSLVRAICKIGMSTAPLLARPVVITARDSDLNVITRHAIPRRWIRWAARRAKGQIALFHEVYGQAARCQSRAAAG